MYLMPFQFTMA